MLRYLVVVVVNRCSEIRVSDMFGSGGSEQVLKTEVFSAILILKDFIEGY